MHLLFPICVHARTTIHNHIHTQVFFDNERWNGEVAKLGVVFVYTPDGMTEEVWQEGLKEYAASKQAAKRAT